MVFVPSLYFKGLKRSQQIENHWFLKDEIIILKNYLYTQYEGISNLQVVDSDWLF